MFTIKTKKTKSPKCPKCHKPMKVMYIQKSYKYNNKIKRYFDKVGYICNHIYRPMVVLTELSEISVNNQDNYMIGVYDCESRDLFKALRSFNLKGIIY